MLNLKIAMTSITFLSSLLLGFHLLFQTISSSGEVVISYPQNGGVVEGVVEIRGSIPAEDFASARVAYSYVGDEDNWFLIARIEQPVEDGLLAAWDTSTITDGIYQLRLTVKTTSGSKLETIVSDLRVANYSHMPTQTVDSSASRELQTTPIESLSTKVPTALPANPAAISMEEFKRTLLAGGLSGIAIVIVFIFLYTVKKFQNRR